jgi:hypothetical protein
MPKVQISLLRRRGPVTLAHIDDVWDVPDLADGEFLSGLIMTVDGMPVLSLPLDYTGGH